MCLSWFSVSGTLLHAWSHSTFFPHFAGWKKRLQGQSKGFYTPTHTHTHSRTHAQTHVSIQACALGWPLHMDACTCAHAMLIPWRLVSTKVSSCLFFHTQNDSHFSLAVQSEINTFLEHSDGWHLCVDYVFTFMAADALFTWNARPLARGRVNSNCTAKGITARMQRAYQLCPNIWLSPRASRRAECYPTPEVL